MIPDTVPGNLPRNERQNNVAAPKHYSSRRRREKHINNILPQRILLQHSFCIYGSWNITEEGAERLREPQYQEVCCKTASPRNGCLNKTRTVKTSMEKFVWKGENFIESCPRQRTWPTNDYWEKET